MSAYLFPLYAVTHFAVFIGCLYLARHQRAPGALLVALIAAGLVYDNGIIALGSSIGVGPILKALNWPRFALHALVTPFMMIAVTRMAIAGGIRWAAGRPWQIIVWVLVLAGMAEGLFGHLLGLELKPACFNGVVRYTANLNPAQFCSDGQVASQGGGPPIPSIVGNLVTLLIGFALWRRHGWIWLMCGALVMFAAASVPSSGFGLAPGNAGEVILLLAYGATVKRFGKNRVRSGGSSTGTRKSG